MADSIPETLEKTYCNKVEPPEKGTPHFKDVYVSNIYRHHAVNILGRRAAHFIDCPISISLISPYLAMLRHGSTMPTAGLLIK